ncbi:recombination mediator RecR [Patescibacteria group bacterium]|nr:recombination mediator RecR [Patescibacteria group bacterium]
MEFIPKNIERVIEEFSKLPGIGSKTAERLAFYLLRKPNEDIKRFGETVGNLKEGIKYCGVCKSLTTEDICSICNNESRDKGTICIVEDMMDLIALEKANQYKGVYHVLHGVIAPVEGVGPDELTIAELIERVKKGGINEIIIALNPSMEGEATAAYITRYIRPMDIKITRIARGIPVGGDLEFADSQTLKRALEGRMDY